MNTQEKSPATIGKGSIKDTTKIQKNNLKPEFDFTRFSPADIQQDAQQLLQTNNYRNENIGLFKILTGNQWIEQAKSRPVPRMLFGEFWFEHELCILFADTNLGKSILAVQIANSISRGEQIHGFKLEAKKQPVIYFDFELSDKQFENRYSINFGQHYIFDSNFIRAEINPEAEAPQDFNSFEDYLHHSLEQSIKETKARILIIDNITYLKTETERAKDALPLMKQLKALKKKYELSILALAHTPKRDLSKPITRNDLQGSKMLINFCDSSFAVGESSTDKSLRYLKQIKARNTEIVYDAENVIICQIDKPVNFLQFEFLNFSNEREHLKQLTEKDNDSRNGKVIELKEQGRSYREIGAELSISHQTVKRIWDKHCNTL
jgi:RecA-family ATPase